MSHDGASRTKEPNQEIGGHEGDRPPPEMDPELIPSRSMIDSGILMRALEHKIDDRTPICREFWICALNNGKKLYIATPTIAEVNIHPNMPELPNTPLVEIVPFDIIAAKDLAQWCSTEGSPH